MNWDDLDFGSKVFSVIAVVATIAMLVACALSPPWADDLTQREVVLGDGTKATCIVVRDAGVTCVPHIVLGPDTEGVE